MTLSVLSFLASPWFVVPWYGIGLLSACWVLYAWLGFIGTGSVPVRVQVRVLIFGEVKTLGEILVVLPTLETVPARIHVGRM